MNIGSDDSKMNQKFLENKIHDLDTYRRGKNKEHS